ncbi:HAMP domain-containing protein [Paenibacillus sp. H1-7]|uniref:sensor histidine kinase n=1 Tax=Paenibacillus sp. H1-7 TaxID=2282849 RepID=UPI001EF949A4|nr:histidine kinase [Paenibacillus sp. H1-7]ULL17104.1 HAMP domain-containing protein [Paenibacillus sp. H1-7]
MRTKLLSIYPKLIFTFLIVIAPIYIISMKMNEFGEQTVRKEVENSMQSRVHFYIRLLENEFNRIVHMQKEFVNDKDLRKLSTAASIISDIEFREAVYSVNTRMKAMMNSSIYIAETTAFLPSEDRMISSLTLYDKLPAEQYEALKAASKELSNPFVYWRDRLFISFPYSDLALINKVDPIFLLSAELSQPELTEVLSRLKIDGSGGAMVIGKGGAWTVSSDPDAEMAESIKPLIELTPTESAEGSFRVVELNRERYWISYESSPSLGITLLMYMPEAEMLGSQHRYREWFWKLSGISLLVIFVFSYWIFRQIHQPMRQLVRAFQSVESGNLSVSIKQDRSDEFHYLYKQFNVMVKRINELIHEVVEQKYRANISELRQLQSQISPHFLYNSFFVLSRMAKYEEYDNINRLSGYLGSYFRFITKTHIDEVILLEEVNYARTYVQIQNFRFEERIRAEFDELPAQFEHLRVPRLILQPVVENVYEHGMRNKVRDGLLNVSFGCRDDRCLVITVQDNGEGLNEEGFADLNRKLAKLGEDMETTGLVNVHRRLKLRFGGLSALQLTNAPGCGLKVELIIPMD